jgi:hypothetical protein
MSKSKTNVVDRWALAYNPSISESFLNKYSKQADKVIDRVINEPFPGISLTLIEKHSDETDQFHPRKSRTQVMASSPLGFVFSFSVGCMLGGFVRGAVNHFTK